MDFYSTSGKYKTNLIGAISEGLAPDGCLYIPEFLPRFVSIWGNFRLPQGGKRTDVWTHFWRTWVHF